MSDMDDDFMCDEDEDYDLVSCSLETDGQLFSRVLNFAKFACITYNFHLMISLSENEPKCLL